MSPLARRPDPVQHRSPSPWIPPPGPGTQRGNSRHLAPGSASREGSERETPGALFLDALFCIYPFAHFPFARKAGGCRAPARSAAPQSYSLLQPCSHSFSLFFSSLQNPPNASQAEATVEAGGRSWLLDTVSRERRCFPFQLLLGQRRGAGGRPGTTQATQTEPRPIRVALALSTPATRCASGHRPRPQGLDWNGDPDQRRQCVLNGKGECVFCFPTPRDPVTSGLQHALAGHGHPGLELLPGIL